MAGVSDVLDFFKQKPKVEPSGFLQENSKAGTSSVIGSRKKFTNYYDNAANSNKKPMNFDEWVAAGQPDK